MLRSWQIDVLHTHDIYTNIFAAPWARFLAMLGHSEQALVVRRTAPWAGET